MGKSHLVVPYSLDANDLKFQPTGNFSSWTASTLYLKDAFDFLYLEGEKAPKMMNVGLHARMMGRPARAAGLARFLDYVQKHNDVWVCRRLDIADIAAVHPSL